MKQLCRKKEDIPPWLMKIKNDSYSPTFISDQASFRLLAQTFSEVFMVVDALDECPKDERSNIIQFISEITKELAHIKVFVTSRWEMDIVDAFKSNNTPTIKIKADSVAADIQTYVTAATTQLRKGRFGKRLYIRSDALEEKIIRTLTDKAEGMFLWVNLQLQHLCRVSQARKDQRVDDALSHIPRDLEATYARIVHQTDEHEPYLRGVALKTLAWVIYAKRPLRTKELQIAIATVDSSQKFEDVELDEVDAILEACANLIVEERGTFRPIHYSVQEFFTNADLTPLQGCSLKEVWEPRYAHTMLSRSCLCYLQLDVLSKGPCTRSRRLESRLGQYPFLGYAARFFDKHILDVYHLPEDIFDLLLKLLSRDGQSLASLLQAMVLEDSSSDFRIVDDFMTMSFPVSASTVLYASVLLAVPEVAEHYRHITVPDDALHWASRNGSTDVVSRLIKEGCALKEYDVHGATPLYYACDGGHISVTELLLEAGADVNAQGPYHGSPLQAASARGYERIVRLLVNKGADVNIQGGYCGTALRAASKGGYESIVQLLIEEGANVDTQGKYYDTVILAASLGYERIVQLLIDKGADVNAQGGDYDTALREASHWGLEVVVRQLLDRGADVNAQGGKYSSPLQAASEKGYQEIVQLLLDSGADVNAQGGKYGNALQAASRRGSEAVVRQLLDSGANVNAQGGKYGNALNAASSRGFEAVVRLLLDSGANVNVQGGVHGSALRAASGNCREAIVRLLLDKGADDKNNAVLEASREGHESVVKLLLDKGADNVNEALLEASRKGQERVVKLLLDKGVNNLDEALLEASREGEEIVVDLLLDKGANTLNEALVAASSEGKYITVELLLDKGADNINEALLKASREGYQNVVKLVLDAGANNINKALLAAFARGHTEIVELLLDKVELLLDKGSENMSETLSAASAAGRQRMVKRLLKKGADVNTPGLGFTNALHAAAYAGSLPVIQSLMSHQADVNVRDEHGWTASMVASKWGYEDIRRVLWDAENLAQKTSSCCLPPTALNGAAETSGITVCEGGLSAIAGSFSHPRLLKLLPDEDDSEKWKSMLQIRANHPFPPDSERPYFEVGIHYSGQRSFIAIGVCNDFSSRGLPGWNQGYWGYHGDNGNLLAEIGIGWSYGPTYGTNDIVGCGVDYTTNKVFFTKNGQYLGPAMDAPKGRLFAVIGIGDKDVHVSINFGPESFVYTFPEVASSTA